MTSEPTKCARIPVVSVVRRPCESARYGVPTAISYPSTWWLYLFPTQSSAMASIHDTEGISHVGIINSTPEEVEWLQAVAPGAVSLEVPGDITAVHSAPKDQLTHKLAMWEFMPC